MKVVFGWRREGVEALWLVVLRSVVLREGIREIPSNWGAVSVKVVMLEERVGSVADLTLVVEGAWGVFASSVPPMIAVTVSRRN